MPDDVAFNGRILNVNLTTGEFDAEQLPGSIYRELLGGYDGVRVAAERIGGDPEQYAVHIDGEELPMHDPRLQPEYHTTYRLDPTPARHTQYEGAGSFVGPAYPEAPRDRRDYRNRGEHHKGASEYMHVHRHGGAHRVHPGVDQPGYGLGHERRRAPAGGRAHREPADGVRGEARQQPRGPAGSGAGRGGEGAVQAVGPLKGVALGTETLERDYLKAADWDVESSMPSRSNLEALGLADVADVIGVV